MTLVDSNVLIDIFADDPVVEDLPPLTRDAQRYRTYFPTVTLIAPDVED